MAIIRIRKRNFFRFLLLCVITVCILVFVSGTGREAILKYLYPIKYSEFVEKYSSEYEIDKYLVYSVIRTESKFKEDAASDAGAKGLMQLMEETAKECNKKGEFNYNIPEDIFNPEVNISLGCFYLKQLIEVYGGDITLAITAYNGGTGNVRNWLKNEELSDGDGGLLEIPFEETKGYVDKVLNSYNKYTQIYKK